MMIVLKEMSPITGKPGTDLVLKVDVERIVNSYKKLNIPVERFFPGLDVVEIRECRFTKYRYYYPFNIFGDAAFYSGLESNNKHYYPKNKWEHLKAIHFIEPGKRILEIGCATGFFLNLIQQKGAVGIGLELNKQAIESAKKNGFAVYNEDINKHAKHHSHQYDVVCSFQVLEHIFDVKDYFESAITCLKPGGILIIGVPNNNPHIYKHDLYHTLNLPPHHAGLWNIQSLEKAAEFFNLKKIYARVEPLKDHKEWYTVQANYYKETKPWLGSILHSIPRPVHKLFTKLFSWTIEGRHMLAVFKLNN